MTTAPSPSEAKIVVLDDDPTGTQTVHGIPVLTEWSVPSLVAELAAPGPCFYLLTNSRAFPVERACALGRGLRVRLLVLGCGQGLERDRDGQRRCRDYEALQVPFPGCHGTHPSPAAPRRLPRVGRVYTPKPVRLSPVGLY